jgi:hypothetical protein
MMVWIFSALAMPMRKIPEMRYAGRIEIFLP